MAPRQLVQIPRTIDLRPQHPLKPIRRQCGDRAVVEHSGKMEYRPKRAIGRNRSQHPRQRRAIRHIARHDAHRLGAELPQRRDKFRSARRVHAAARRQQKMPHPMHRHQVPRHRSPELADTSRNEHRRHAPKPHRRGALRIVGPHRNQARSEPALCAQRKLRLAIQCQRRQDLPRDPDAGIEVHQPQPAVGMLAARAAHEAPQRRMRKVRRQIVRPRPDRRARHEHHRRRRQTRLREQLLKRPQRLSRRTLSRSRYLFFVAVDRRQRIHDHPIRNRRSTIERSTKRRHRRISLDPKRLCQLPGSQYRPL